MASEQYPSADNTPSDERERQATSFVFGELSPQEAAAFQEQLSQSSELQATVASIREAVTALESEFAVSTPEMNADDRQRIETAMQPAPPASPAATVVSPNDSSRRWILLLASAAALLLVAGLTLPIANRSMTAGKVTEELREEIQRIERENAQLREEKQQIKERLAEREEMPAAETAKANPPTFQVELSAAAASQPPETPRARSHRRQLSQGGMGGAVATGINDMLMSDDMAGDKSQSPLPRRGRRLSEREGAMMGMDMMEGMDMDGMMESGGATAETKNAPAGEPGDIAAFELSALSEPASADGERGAADEVRRNVEPFFQRRLGEWDALSRRSRQPMGGGDRFTPIVDNRFRSPREEPLSTFSIDVDTAAYAKVRMDLMQSGRLPDPNAVRIEEMINYFDYAYPPPAAHDETPFNAAMEIAGCPWNPSHRLARIGIKGKVIEQDRPASNLVFLLDVSGSMNRPNKLPLVISGMKMLVNQLDENDSVAVAVYAGAAGLVLDATSGDRKKVIYDALDRLRAGGSTNGGEGIRLAYDTARDHFIDGGTNRVILCSDGDFNVGVTGTDQLVEMAAKNAQDDIFLTVLGFGSGNHNDAMMEQISNRGNGNYAFIDTEDEARKVFVDQMQGTLVTIAKDVKIQVEFNPGEVQSYRLIGYANRMLAAEDFNDDTKDAGEIGAGHTVTALYEIVPVSQVDDGEDRPSVDALKYQRRVPLNDRAESGELLTLKLRYKPPTGDESTLLEFPVKDSGKPFEQADTDFQFAASVASFGMLLRDSRYKGNANYEMVREIAESAADIDRTGYRDEFVSLIEKARQLSSRE